MSASRAPVRLSEVYEICPMAVMDDVPMEPAVIIEMFMAFSDPAEYVQDDPVLISTKQDLLSMLEFLCGGRGSKLVLFHRGQSSPDLLDDGLPTLTDFETDLSLADLVVVQP